MIRTVISPELRASLYGGQTAAVVEQSASVTVKANGRIYRATATTLHAAVTLVADMIAADPTGPHAVRPTSQ